MKSIVVVNEVSYCTSSTNHFRCLGRVPEYVQLTSLSCYYVRFKLEHYALSAVFGCLFNIDNQYLLLHLTRLHART
jgi:hypothetical protein